MRSIIVGAIVASSTMPLVAHSTTQHVWSPGLRPPASEPPAKPQIQPTPPATPQALLPDQQARDTAPAGPSVEEGGVLSLMCFGGGSANKTTSATAWGWSSNGTSGTATILGERSQGFDDQVSLHIQGNEGKLRMPRTMLPTVHGGDDGWFKLHDIKLKPSEITASIGVNFINNPRLRLDRYTGAISISGRAGDYTGQCRRYDPERMERKF